MQHRRYDLPAPGTSPVRTPRDTALRLVERQLGRIRAEYLDAYYNREKSNMPTILGETLRELVKARTAIRETLCLK